jgi:hypothetical protein
LKKVGRDSIVSIATHYGLDGPEIESRWGRNFLHMSRQALGPSLLYNGYWVSFPQVKRPRHGINYPLPSSTEVKERVELYLYSPSEPSWPVIGQTLPFTINCSDFNMSIQRLRKEEGKCR